MKKANVLLFASGLLPLAAGLLINALILLIDLPLRLIGLAALIGWGTLANLWKRRGQSRIRIILLPNLLAAVDLMLLAIQLLINGQYWHGIVGGWSQLYFAPFHVLGYTLTSWSQDVFPSYAASLLLMMLASFVGCSLPQIKAWPQKLRNRFRRSMTAITGLLVCAALILWGICMYCVTSVTAEYAADRFIEENEDLAEDINYHFYHRTDQPDWQNYWRSLAWDAVNRGLSSQYRGTLNSVGENGFFERRSVSEDYYAAAIYDTEGTPLAQSWDDYISFEFMTEDQWAARQERSYHSARALFDREKITEEGQVLFEHSGSSSSAKALRLTGRFDGMDFTPTKIEFISWDDFYGILYSQVHGSYTVSGVVQDYDLPWITAYEDPNALDIGEAPVVFYSDYFRVCCREVSPALSKDGKSYENLGALLEALGPTFAGSVQSCDSSWFDGTNLILLDVSYRMIIDGEVTHTEQYYSPEAFSNGVESELTHYTVSAVLFSPWRIALRELRNVYILTFLLLAVLVLVVRSVIRTQLVAPVQEINAFFAGDHTYNYRLLDWPPKWEEPKALSEHYTRTQDQLRMNQNEIKRLNTALEYAKTAEENRRQMVSNIAHEFKTPLAVIHSYAEGLNEHIAEGKREKYLNVILSESDRLDNMVLELLDLSRLEAGKVRLARDQFDLAELTHSVFDRLDMAAQAKGLTVTFDHPDACPLHADEGRIRQVIENFASNAVKYTPDGGAIRVTVQPDIWATQGTKMTFSVENDSPPLPKEALTRVWETFYRVDDSRSGGGTGLGLAIARNIVELHGGKCSVSNTRTGVKFQFTI